MYSTRSSKYLQCTDWANKVAWCLPSQSIGGAGHRGRGLPWSHSELEKAGLSNRTSCAMSMLSLCAVQNASHSLRVSFQHLKYG